MGKWNHRRWTTRKRYNQPSPPPPPTYYETEYKLRGARKNTALPWEERFCISGGIPWQKVVVAKRYMYCHDNVVKWNDSAGEEAFHNAKRQFWALINGLPCDTPVPDPNTYIDEIDWNPKVDPDLMLDIDREYFNPDEAGKVSKLEISNSGWGERNPSTVDNPWEYNRALSNGVENVATGWSPWDKSTNVNAHNPWGCGNTQDDEVLKDTKWGGCAGKLWEWKSGVNFAGSSQRLDNSCGDLWNHGGQSAGSVKEKSWGDIGTSSQSWSNWGTNAHEPRSLGQNVTPWKSQAGGGPENKQWKDCKGNSSAWDQWENQGNVKNHLDYSGHSGNDRFPNGGCLKREGSQQYTSRYKSSRVQVDDCATNHQWRKQRNQNRVSFALE